MGEAAAARMGGATAAAAADEDDDAATGGRRQQTCVFLEYRVFWCPLQASLALAFLSPI